MEPTRMNSLRPKDLPTSGEALQTFASPSNQDEPLPLLEIHEDLLVRAAVDSATEALQRELTATLLKLEVQSEATIRAHEIIKELEQEIANFHSEEMTRVAEHELLMQAVAESARERSQRDLAVMQEDNEQLQAALSTSFNEVQQARNENKLLAAKMATTQQLLAVAETEVHELRQQLDEKLKIADDEAQEMHQRYCSEVLALRAELQLEKETVTRLQADNMEAVAQLQAAKEAVTRLQMEMAEAVTQLQVEEKTVAQKVVVDGSVLVESRIEEDGEDVVLLRARCGALRRELGSTRAQLASVTKVWEAAAQGRLAEIMAEAHSAGDAGEVKNDEDFWARNSEVHALHTLVTSLRATRLYAGAVGAGSTYGDNRADGAGSVGMASSAQLATSHRRTRLLQLRETLGQMGELLSGAEATVKQRRQQSSLQQLQQPMRLPSPPSPPQPQPQLQGQGQKGSQASVWGRVFSLGGSSDRSRGPHKSGSSASSSSRSCTDSCATLNSCGANSLHDYSSKCGHSMGLRSSTESLQQVTTVGTVADELADLYDLYQIPVQPNYEFNTWS
ncbi:hypothetical protein VaNZ11_010531 [Volvox africanus]|uniref:Cilia- and flagella-associated protein 157 n=1 Tax=Volvox africanus TaxID=51714 RepID=A0ABQ5S9R3_9CHLO|nr:hypothetical protein VaNZ11_010531 [Volvox africanus]